MNTRDFYAELGVDRLRRRTRNDWDEQTVAALREILPPRCRVLDVGCGYGRVAVPLARLGYEVVGLDLAPNLVIAAHHAAAASGCGAYFLVGSMSALPCRSNTFASAICLWSAFHELLLVDDQIRAITEIWRVLAPRGFALIEGPLYEPATEAQLAGGARRGTEGRVSWSNIDGLSYPHYHHDEDSFRRLCQTVGIASFSVFERDWAGRQRLFLRFDKTHG